MPKTEIVNLRNNGKKIRIIVYCTEYCPWCDRAKEVITSKGFNFESIDIAKSKEAYEEMFRKSGQNGIPVIDINGKIIIGFSEEEISENLKFVGH